MTKTIAATIAGGIIAALAFATFAPVAFAAVSTDKSDYAPGETVTISGDGYLAGETVLIDVTAPYGSENGGATANAGGEFSWSFILPNDESAFGDYNYTATGEDSGIVQSGTFTDGNVKAFPLPTTVTFTLTETVYDTTVCTGAILDGPDVFTGVSDPSGETAGVGNTDSIKLQAAAFSDQGGAFIGWTTSETFVGTSTTVVTGDSICVTGNFTGNHSFFANYGSPPGVLSVVKVLINDNGGTAATSTFSFQINGASTTPFNAAGVVNFSVASSTYSITELAAAGYTTSYSNSKNGSANCTNLAVTSGATTTCTIINDDQPGSISGMKFNDLDGDGIKDGGEPGLPGWTIMLFDGTNTISTTTDANGNYMFENLDNVAPALYGVCEQAQAGWQQTLPNASTTSTTLCVAFATGDLGYLVDLQNGENVTGLDFGNFLLPQLTVTKIVINDNGGTATTSDFALFIDGFSVTSGVASTTSLGAHSVSETPRTGYTAGVWGGDCAANGSITLTPGQNATCTITNDDDPASLTLVKVVISDDGGVATTTDWTLTATGPTGFSGFGPSVTNAGIDAGTYDLSENGPSGYAASNWACTGGNQTDGDTIEIDSGETVVCTITNDDIAATPPPGPSCTPATAGGITITICNRGSIGNVTSADSSTGSNVAGGSTGGRGGRGGDVDPAGSENNGGASAGNGGNGGSGDAGGLVNTGDATSEAGTENDLNGTDAGVDLGDCGCGDINGLTLDVDVDNDRVAPTQNVINNDTRARARTGENLAQGSTGGDAGNGGEVEGGSGNENNGGASAGTGGAGGAGGIGGTIFTGNAVSTAGTVNRLNTTRMHITR